MKKILLNSTAIVLLSLFSSCSSSSSSDETQGTPEDNSTPTTYLPLKTANFWDYRVENRASATATASTFYDRLNVGSDWVNNAITYKKMLTTAAPNGFFSSLLNNNGLRIDGTRLKVTGTLTNTFFPGLPITVNLDDFIILKDNAAVGTLLSTVAGQTTQTISGNPVTFDYILRSYAGGSLSTFTSNSVNYTNVKKTKVVLTLTATAPFGGVPVIVLTQQDVSTATFYFAPNIGMVYDYREVGYILNPTVATQLGVPASSNQVQEEYLGTYDVSH